MRCSAHLPLFVGLSALTYVQFWLSQYLINLFILLTMYVSKIMLKAMAFAHTRSLIHFKIHTTTIIWSLHTHQDNCHPSPSSSPNVRVVKKFQSPNHLVQLDQFYILDHLGICMSPTHLNFL